MNHMWYVAQRLPTPSQSSGGRAPGNAGRQAEQVKARMQDVTTDRTKQVKADRKKNPPESSQSFSSNGPTLLQHHQGGADHL